MCTAERMSGFHVIWLSVAAVLLSTASQGIASYTLTGFRPVRTSVIDAAQLAYH